MPRISHLLSHHGLRNTQVRAEVLRLFIEANKALSQPELETALKGRCDRVTIYRSLATFVEKGILHRVPDDSGTARYALCEPECREHHVHHHDHVHFKCRVCGETHCVNEVSAPHFSLPTGYQVEQVDLLVSGLCPVCNA